jgi:hypothetical protein
MIHINVYGDIHPSIWESQSLTSPEEGFKFHYRNYSNEAQWAVYIGNAGKDYTLDKCENQVFMLVEPPEVYVYKKDFLKKFTHIVGPAFSEYKDLANFNYSNVCLPWSVGLSFQDTKSDLKNKILRKFPSRISQLFTEPPEIAFNIIELLGKEFEKIKSISVVTSNKDDTPMQRQRIAFIQYLQDRKSLPLKIYGRGYLPIRDKFEILSRSTHHLALENSSHQGNWTEKLSDSILTLNKSYYVGAPDIKNYFSSNIVQPIDLSNFEQAEAQIIEDFEYGDIMVKEILSARNELVKNYSFESVIKKLVDHGNTHWGN